MNFGRVEQIADAVLYEGYILYPYRPSSVKNQQRWNFGALCPESYSEAQRGTESWTMQTECIVQPSSRATLDVKVRFLHLLIREVGERIADCGLRISDCGHFRAGSSDSHFALVPALDVNGQRIQAWQEAVEREVYLRALNLNELGRQPHSESFSFPGSETVETLIDDGNGEVVGLILRKQQAIQGTIEIHIEALSLKSSENGINRQSAIGNRQSPLKLTVRIENQTQLTDADQRTRDEALMRSFVSTHTILGVTDGEFVSLLDPPEALRGAAGNCSNVGTYPVLAGDEGTRDCMLSSPIILYDYPQIAPESAGNLFDGTEIDEILTLRIMTLTEEEKREMRGADDRARQILERTELLPAEQLMKMHGAMKGVGRKS